MRLLFLAFAFTLVIVSATEQTCNNSPSLCGVSYDRVTHFGPHNSSSIGGLSTLHLPFDNQYFDIPIQLDASARLLTTQVHQYTVRVTKARQLRFCHRTCIFPHADSNSDWLWQSHPWVDQNLNEFGTLALVSSHLTSAPNIQADFSKADIAQSRYLSLFISAPPPSSKSTNSIGPTLGRRLTKGEKLATFVNPFPLEGENPQYLLHELRLVWKMEYDVPPPSDLRCTHERPSDTSIIADLRTSGGFFLMEYILYKHQAFGIMTLDIGSIKDTNAWDGCIGFGTYLTKRTEESRREPTFVLKDYFDFEYAIKSVDMFDNIGVPVSRKHVTSEGLRSE